MEPQAFREVTALCAACILVMLGALFPLAQSLAQDVPPGLELRGVEYTAVDGQPRINAVLDNRTPVRVEASGLLSIVDAGGLEVQRVNVTTGPMPSEESSVVAIPLPAHLADGRYTATLALEVTPDEQPLLLGPHTFTVEGSAAQRPVGSEESRDSEPQRGFPAWILLAGGALLIVFGLMFRREREVRRTRGIPEVAFVRKVQVRQSPLKKPARIKKLLPPGRREEN